MVVRLKVSFDQNNICTYQVPNMYNNISTQQRPTAAPVTLLDSLRLGQGTQPASLIINLGAHIAHMGPSVAYPFAQLASELLLSELVLRLPRHLPSGVHG